MSLAHALLLLLFCQIDAVTTQGVDGRWVDRYDLRLTCDDRKWVRISDVMVNTDGVEVYTSYLPQPVIAKRVRFYPRHWSRQQAPSGEDGHLPSDVQQNRQDSVSTKFYLWGTPGKLL